MKRDKTNSVLYKHKKWLHELKMERQRLEEALLEEEARKKLVKQRYRMHPDPVAHCTRFSEREAKMRAAIRQASSDGTRTRIAQ